MRRATTTIGRPRASANAGQRDPARWLKPITFVAASVPFVLLVVDAFTGGLGVNPVETITHSTGKTALQLLALTLAVTPFRRVSGWNVLARLRRMLGLFTFFYAGMHFLTYAILDASLDPAYVLDDILERPYITVGFTAFCILVALAATSTDGMVRRLGGLAWRRLHKLVYVAGGCVVLHYLWLVKADYLEPAIYAGIFALLMALRVPHLARRLPRLRASFSWKRAAPMLGIATRQPSSDGARATP